MLERDKIPVPSRKLIEADMRLIAKRAVRLEICQKGWFENASVTIGYHGQKASKGGKTRGGRVKVSIANPPRSFLTRSEIESSLQSAIKFRRPKYERDYRRYLDAMDCVGKDFFRLEYHSIRHDPEIGDGPFDNRTKRYAMGALLSHEIAHAVCANQAEHAAHRLDLLHLMPAQMRAHQKLWREVYRALRRDFFGLLDQHYENKRERCEDA
ncbi:hypothetical protein [Ruegeria arenilitoris]|uniref:hypothetical protein n=1 Tax=Ruegeria arenilitoris TaxID=1173585 RepID=UPI00147BEDF7|nr:hypothetical protein [Ruegeria arenilitoris]